MQKNAPHCRQTHIEMHKWNTTNKRMLLWNPHSISLQIVWLKWFQASHSRQCCTIHSTRDCCRNCKGKACCSCEVVKDKWITRQFKESKEKMKKEQMSHLVFSKKRKSRGLKCCKRGNLTSSTDKKRWSKTRYSTEDCGEEGKQKSGKNLACLFLDAGEEELSTSHRK